MSSAILLRMGELAREAGRGILETYQRGFEVHYKAPDDPVTEADRRANDYLCEHLGREFPDAAIVAEESDPAGFANFRESRQIFFVDPLDGTREFVARNDQFVVMIGMVQGERPTLGVVYAPTTDTLWAGECGVGAYRQQAEGAPEPLVMSAIDCVQDAKFVVSRSRRSARLSDTLTAVGASQIVPTGSAGLKGAEIAQGTADAYLAVGPCGKLWDSCAVEALVTAAGGKLTNAHGGAIDYRAPQLDLTEGILGANAKLHSLLWEQLGGVLSSAR